MSPFGAMFGDRAFLAALDPPLAAADPSAACAPAAQPSWRGRRAGPAYRSATTTTRDQGATDAYVHERRDTQNQCAHVRPMLLTCSTLSLVPAFRRERRHPARGLERCWCGPQPSTSLFRAAGEQSGHEMAGCQRCRTRLRPQILCRSNRIGASSPECPQTLKRNSTTSPSDIM